MEDGRWMKTARVVVLTEAKHLGQSETLRCAQGDHLSCSVLYLPSSICVLNSSCLRAFVVNDPSRRKDDIPRRERAIPLEFP
jgi:hypothetical protein